MNESYMYVFVLNIIFTCSKMVEILVDFIVKLYQFPLLPYRWSKIPLRRNGNNYLTSNSELRRNGNKPMKIQRLGSGKCRYNFIT